jgi:hypothetical protein
MHRAKIVGILWLAVLILAACGETAPPASGGGTPTPISSVLNSAAQSVTLDQVKQEITDLYTQHPNINSFTVQSVTYTPETRDKVLQICSEGSVAVSAQELESQQVTACAPLIFFFYYYGQQNAVPEGIDISQKLYWFAANGKSADSQKSLVTLLRSWGIQ